MLFYERLFAFEATKPCETSNEKHEMQMSVKSDEFVLNISSRTSRKKRQVAWDFSGFFK